MAPPPELLKDCVETQTDLDLVLGYLARMETSAAAIEQSPVITNGDLVRKIRALRNDLRVCNADKAALRGWVADRP